MSSNLAPNSTIPEGQCVPRLAIRVHNISKRYQIYDAPRDRLKQFVLPRLHQIVGKAPKQYFREFSALNSVSFEVKKGETVGIIGRNGAGKSTLLQILCGTLTPTDGVVEVNGRVAALLELGSGFNSEFTGRENIYMNAGVLGLSRQEIEARFDHIVAFADIGDFLDQPVKTYSSGMYVRLAFAVVVHVDADILIIDEALSVGDMYFQAKCMAHMKKLMSSGVTVLFVSHDTSAVKSLCSRAVYLEQGTVVVSGATDDVVEAYYGSAVRSRQSIATSNIKKLPNDLTKVAVEDQLEFAKRAGYQRLQNGMAEFIIVQLLDEYGQKIEMVEFGQKVILRMLIQANVNLPTLSMGYHIRNRNGFDVIYSDSGIENCHISDFEVGEVVAVDWSFTVHLCSGEYTIATGLSIPLDLSAAKVEVCDWIPIALNLKVAMGRHLPIHATAYWPNKVEIQRVGSSSNA